MFETAADDFLTALRSKRDALWAESDVALERGDTQESTTLFLTAAGITEAIQIYLASDRFMVGKY